MKALSKIAIIVTIAATVGACASQNGYTNEREYRNPYLRAKHIAAPAKSSCDGEQSCIAKQSQ